MRRFLIATLLCVVALSAHAQLAGVDVRVRPGQLNKTIGFGTAVLATGAISSATCATVVSVAIPNALTTDVIWWGFNSDPTGVTGYQASSSGMLTIIAYPTVGNANFKVCNNTSSSITPGAITLNVRVVR